MYFCYIYIGAAFRTILIISCVLTQQRIEMKACVKDITYLSVVGFNLFSTDTEAWERTYRLKSETDCT